MSIDQAEILSQASRITLLAGALAVVICYESRRLPVDVKRYNFDWKEMRPDRFSYPVSVPYAV